MEWPQKIMFSEKELLKILVNNAAENGRLPQGWKSGIFKLSMEMTSQGIVTTLVAKEEEK